MSFYLLYFPFLNIYQNLKIQFRDFRDRKIAFEFLMTVFGT